MTVQAISSPSRFKEVLQEFPIVVVDFGARWCETCEVIAPTFAKLSEEYTGIEFCEVDVDEQGEIAEEVQVKTMPTFILFKDGEKVQDVVGANAGDLHSMLQSVM